MHQFLLRPRDLRRKKTLSAINILQLHSTTSQMRKITRLGCFYVTAIMSWGWRWVEVDIEVEVEMRLSWSSFCLFPSILIFDLDLIFRSFFYFLGPLWAIFGVRVGFDNCFRVYSCSWTTLIFFVSFNSDIWFLLNFWILFTFWGPYGLFFGFW